MLIYGCHSERGRNKNLVFVLLNKETEQAFLKMDCLSKQMFTDLTNRFVSAFDDYPNASSPM